MQLLRKIETQAFDKMQYLLGSSITRWPFSELTTSAWRALVARMPRRPGIMLAPERPAMASGERPLELPPGGGLLTNVKDAGLLYFDELSQAAHDVFRKSDFDRLVREKRGKTYEYKIDLLEVQPEPGTVFTKFAMQPRILELARSYLGVTPQYFAQCLWMDIPTEADPVDTQKWHRDPDDFKCLKVFVQLSEVTPETGPFCYVPVEHSRKLYGQFGKFRRFDHRHRVSDEEMREYVPEKDWVTVTGPVGTVAFVDTASCFHRGLKPRSGRRFMFQAVFTSAAPRVYWNR
ncbi:MAG: phytanoyl-CoA dioxygenase family protein [Deltaproteobacteria bacterium]|nr:phytanoyl-CoA dioxygenase family protein [Deltaproteobacteria bacterium]